MKVSAIFLTTLTLAPTALSLALPPLAGLGFELRSEVHKREVRLAEARAAEKRMVEEAGKAAEVEKRAYPTMVVPYSTAGVYPTGTGAPYPTGTGVPNGPGSYVPLPTGWYVKHKLAAREN